MGETLPEREGGHTLEKVQGQLDRGLAGVSGADWERVTVAYEPIWAIGTGRNATPEQAEEVHRHIRGVLEDKSPGPADPDPLWRFGQAGEQPGASFAGEHFRGPGRRRLLESRASFLL